MEAANEPDEIIGTVFTTKEFANGKLQQAEVIGDAGNGNFFVKCGEVESVMSKDEILQGRSIVEEIVGHQGRGGSIQVIVKWKSHPLTSREPLSSLKRQIPEKLAEYADHHNLTTLHGWTWTQKYFSTTEVVGIESHTGSGKKIKLTIRFDDGSIDTEPMHELMKDSKDLLAQYCQDKGLSKAKGWEWVSRYMVDRKKDWFSRVQTYLTDVMKLCDFDRLTSKLHGLFKHEQNAEYRTAFGQAYKESIDIRKHGGKVHLPIALHSKVE